MCFSKEVLGTALRDIMNENVPKYLPPSPTPVRKRSRRGTEVLDPSQVRRVIVLDFDGPVKSARRNTLHIDYLFCPVRSAHHYIHPAQHLLHKAWLPTLAHR